MATRRSLNWKRLVLVSIGIGAAVGLIFGILGTVFDISIPGGIIGATCGVIIGTVIARWRQNSTE